jgi:peroxiredoxin Q/BCP
MAQLRDDYSSFVDRNAKILVIGPENKKAFEKYFTENDLPFIGLPDPSHSVLKLYGQEVKLFKMGRMPALLIVDLQGNVRFVHYGHEMSDIPANEDVLTSLDSIKQSAAG